MITDACNDGMSLDAMQANPTGRAHYLVYRIDPLNGIMHEPIATYTDPAEANLHARQLNEEADRLETLFGLRCYSFTVRLAKHIR